MKKNNTLGRTHCVIFDLRFGYGQAWGEIFGYSVSQLTND